MAWLTRIGVHSCYVRPCSVRCWWSARASACPSPPPSTPGTFGVAPGDAGVASATLNVGQQLGGSIGTALLNTIATSAAATFVASHLTSAAASVASRAGGGQGERRRARLHDRVLVDGRHLRGWRHHLRGPAAPRAARQPGATCGQRPGHGWLWVGKSVTPVIAASRSISWSWKAGSRASATGSC